MELHLGAWCLLLSEILQVVFSSSSSSTNVPDDLEEQMHHRTQSFLLGCYSQIVSTPKTCYREDTTQFKIITIVSSIRIRLRKPHCTYSLIVLSVGGARTTSILFGPICQSFITNYGCMFVFPPFFLHEHVHYCILAYSETTQWKDL